MIDAAADPLVPLALLVLVLVLVVLARARRWASVCQRCEWRARSLTVAAATRASLAHAEAHGHDVNVYRRVDDTEQLEPRRDDTRG